MISLSDKKKDPSFFEANSSTAKDKSVELLCSHCSFPIKKKGPFSSSSENSAVFFCCYGCAFVYQLLHSNSASKSQVILQLKLGFAAFFAMNVMGFSLVMHASSLYPDFYVQLSNTGKAFDALLRYFLLLLTMPVIFLVGIPLIENTWRDIRTRTWTIDGLLAIGVFSSFFYSLISTFRGYGPLYYDLATMVLFFLTMGRYLEAQFRLKAKESLRNLLDQKIQTSRILENEGEKIVDISAIRPGDTVILKAGDRIPIDGEVIKGEAMVEVAPMTGEFLPKVKFVGEIIDSGGKIIEGYLWVKAKALAKDSWMARLKTLITQAEQSKSPIQTLANRLAWIFSWIIVLLSAFAFILGYLEQGFGGGVIRALSVLLIACPCALGAAVPLALWNAFEKITSRGILFKDLSRIETLAKVKGVFFDKTGTLTETMPSFKSLHRFGDLNEDEALQLAACLAQVSNHPLSRAIVEEAKRRNAVLSIPLSVMTSVGKGIRGVMANHREVLLGSRQYLRDIGIDCSSADQLTIFDHPHVFLVLNGKLQAAFIFFEKVRFDLFQTMAHLKKQNYEISILTGDTASSAEEIRKLLNVDVVPSLSPAEKLDWVSNWQKKNGAALMVGEGLNDAPVLAAASVSISMASAVAHSQDVSDFVLPDNHLERISWLLSTAKHTLKRIHRNLFWAFFYNVLALPLALMGKINPLIAGAAMLLSSIFVMKMSIAGNSMKGDDR